MSSRFTSERAAASAPQPSNSAPTARTVFWSPIVASKVYAVRSPAHRCPGPSALRARALADGRPIVLVLGGGGKRRQPVADDYVAGRARAGFLARVLDLDAVVEQRVADRHPLFRVEGCTRGADVGMREDVDAGHG